MGYARRHRLAAVRHRAGPDARPVRVRPEARLLRRRRGDDRASPSRSAARSPTAARSPGAYRRYLGQALADHVRASSSSARSCCRCCTWSRPLPAAGPGVRRRARRSIPATPLTGDVPGRGVPDLQRARSTATTRNLMLVKKGREREHVRRPGRPDRDADRLAGPLADARAGLDVRSGARRTSRPPGRSSTSRGCCSTPPRSRS